MNNGHVVVKQVICHVLLLNTSLTRAKTYFN